LTLSADGKTAATVQVRGVHTVDVLPGAGLSGSAGVTPLAQVREPRSVDWTAGGKLLVSNGHSIMRMNSDGSGGTQILSDANAGIVDFTRCGEKYLVLSWAFRGGGTQSRLWRTDSDGTNAKQISSGDFDIMPVCSPDGKWVYYYAAGERQSAAMRVLVEGGASEPVPGGEVPNMYGFGAGQTVSRDGHTLIFSADISVPGNAVSKLAFVHPEENAHTVPRLLDPDKRITGGGGTGNFANTMTVSPDGKSVAYVIRDKGVDNIWLQPFEGGAGRAITNFTSEHIVQFRWSPDGKQLAVSRFHAISDVVLLREK
jgi:WD40 repeat protein